MKAKEKPPALATRAARNHVSFGGLDGSENSQRAATTRVVVYEFEKNSRETFRVSLGRYRNRDVVDVREWWRDATGELKPGRSGITNSVKHLPQLAAAIGVALAEARSRLLRPPEDGDADPSDEARS